MDEADRLLELGFVEEINEVVRSCPKQRQTMLFSATLTSQVLFKFATCLGFRFSIPESLVQTLFSTPFTVNSSQRLVPLSNRVCSFDV